MDIAYNKLDKCNKQLLCQNEELQKKHLLIQEQKQILSQTKLNVLEAMCLSSRILF